MVSEHFPNHRQLLGKHPPNLSGGIVINKIPPAIPWEDYVACGMRVMHADKLVVVVLDPQHTNDVDEAIALLRFLMAMHTPKTGPIAWETVPENVRRHFRVIDSEDGNTDNAAQDHSV